jgi:phenylalanyl-tRNA synthetase beta chain
MKVLLSWIREFVDVPESAEEIGKLMSVRGLALEGLEPHGDDVAMDFDVTANRPDCLSMIGIAREIATAYQRPLRADAATAKAVALRTSTDLPVTIEDPDLCPRYAGAVADVTVGPSPQWLQDRLKACGIRSISNVVDITNYVASRCTRSISTSSTAAPSSCAARSRASRSRRSTASSARSSPRCW